MWGSLFRSSDVTPFLAMKEREYLVALGLTPIQARRVLFLRWMHRTRIEPDSALMADLAHA